MSEVALVWQEDMVLGETLENLEKKATKAYVDLMWVALHCFTDDVTYRAALMDKMMRDIFFVFIICLL